MDDCKPVPVRRAHARRHRLVARREDRLRDLAAARAGLFDEVDRRGLTADILVNNAGIGTIGSVTKRPVDDEIAQVRVNVEAVIDLTADAARSSTSAPPRATTPSRGRPATRPPRRS